ncbi:Ankyrin repeat-containing domain protein [Rhypophila sp. PSN 637]
MASSVFSDSVSESALLEFWVSCLSLPESLLDVRNHEPGPVTQTLYGIPVEIMQDIASYLGNKRDLLALTRTNRWLYSVVNPMLYAYDIKFNHSSSIFWGAGHGLLGTLIHARAAGANLDMQRPYRRIYRRTDGGTPLHYAARAGHDHLVQRLIDQGVDINAPSRGSCNCGHEDPVSNSPDIGWIPLHTALCHNKLSAAMILLNQNSSLDLMAPGSDRDDSKSHRYALHVASARGMLSIIDHLYSNFNIDINMRDPWGYTPLHHAARGLRGQPRSPVFRETAVRLLSLGADIDLINIDGETPLATAVREGNFLAAIRLLKLGASADPRPHEPGAAAVRPLFLCARYHPYHADTRVYRWPDEKQNGKWYQKRHLRHKSNTEALIRALVDAGADANAPFGAGDDRVRGMSVRGMTALAVACCSENWTAVSALVKCGASVHIQDGDGNTPLYHSLFRLSERTWCEKCEKAVLFLLRKGARMDSNSLNIVFDWLPRPLFKQLLEVSTKDISHDEFEKVIMSPDRRNDSEHDPPRMKLLLDFAKRTYGISRRSIQRYLKNIFEADDYGSFQVLRDDGYVRLVPYQAEVNKPEYLANPSAVSYSLESLLVKSLRLGADQLSDILVRSVGLSTIGPRFSGGSTLLHIAVSEQKVSVVEELLDRGADGNDFDDDFDTPLSIAVAKESMELVRILLKDGANPHARPSKSQLQERRKEESFESAFEDAIRCRQPPTCYRFSSKRGADPNGGEGCLNPPAAMILKNLWENQEENDYELELAFQKLGLLLALPLDHGDGEELKEFPIPTPLHEILVTICQYDGDDEYRVSLKELVSLELGTTAVHGEDKLACERPDGIRVPITHSCNARLPREMVISKAKRGRYSFEIE